MSTRLLLLAALLIAAPARAEDLPHREGKVEPGQSAEVAIPKADRARSLSVLISLKDPGPLKAGAPTEARVTFGSIALRKNLHLGDPDVLWTVAAPAETEGRIALEASKDLDAPARFSVRVIERTGDDPEGVAFESEPNDTPKSANPLTLGRTVYGLADDRPYLPLGEKATKEEEEAGRDWFRFEVPEGKPRLLFFALEFIDRDVPPDVRVYVMKDGKPVEFTEGIDPQSLQRERPPRPGANKFTTRVLSPGTYFVMVDACQPDYQLRTKVFDPPPYIRDKDSDESLAAAARKAVRVSMDFQLLAGDSWHANTPRKGHPLDRINNPHHETSTCIACHPTHFTTQSALAAVKAGYRVEQPFALRFLTERLANNPVPFPGHPDAVWARMIPAPANVLGRLSTILMDYEEVITDEPHEKLHQEIANFLGLYYGDRTKLPPDESNGNNPVSRYKVAADAWRQLDGVARRTGSPRYEQERDIVAALIPTGEPSTTRDLAARLIGLMQSGHKSDSPEVRADVDRLLKLQLPDGHWPIKLKGDTLASQMQTGESLYALALAGLKPDHPVVHKGVVALLTTQKPFGGWLDTNPYEQFRTPFRETQWSLMALATLYPGPGNRAWDGPLGPQPKALHRESASMLVRDLERIWDRPHEKLVRQIGEAAGHDDPIVRLAACSALGRIGRKESIEPLCDRLGDESKVVQRAAAEALRSIGNRAYADPRLRPDRDWFFSAMLTRMSPRDSRAERGVTRIFASHFREISRDRVLESVLRRGLHDHDPIVRMQAVKGMWRWWYWQRDPSIRQSIENAFIAALCEPQHPWVRRNLTDALYILNDENIRYFDNQWVPSLARAEDREKATQGMQATVNRLGEKFAKAIRRDKFMRVVGWDNPLRREGVLTAMSEFPERGVLSGRVGNDIEPILYYGETAAHVADALLSCLSDPDPKIRRLALQALVTVRERKDPAIARAVLRRRGDEDATVRQWADTMADAKLFPVRADDPKDDPKLLAVVDELMALPGHDAHTAALEVLGRLGEARSGERTSLLGRDLSSENPAVRAAALRAARSFPKLLDDPHARAAIAKAIDDDEPSVRVAALRLALDRPGLVPDAKLRAALLDKAPEHRLALLQAIESDPNRKTDLRLVGAVADSLVESDRGVREKALAIVQATPDLVANPAVEEALRELSRSDNERQKGIATALLRSRGKSSAGSEESSLDLAYFEAKILPIFNAKGEDGQNCIGCHRSHTILAMNPPGASGHWSPEDVRATYRAALRVVNPASPAKSLLAQKPTWEAADEAEAQKDPSKKAHAGGVRFEPGSPEYQTILDWINGARLRPSATPEAIRSAVERALPLIVKSVEEYPKHRDCFSCHHQAVPALAITTVRDRGFTIEDDTLAAAVDLAESDLHGALDSYKKGQGQGGGVTRAGYALLTLELGKHEPDDATDAVTGFFLTRDEAKGYWATSSNRPPSEASPFTTSYVALRGLRTFGREEQKDRIAARVEKARAWLEGAKPKDTEDRVFRLLALKEAGASEAILRQSASDLLATRREDGGWSQLDGAESDAYATGSALYALHVAGGLKTDDPVYRKGLAFLIGAQKPDGSWFVKSRSKPFQPYFESGFPYKNDQFISMAASSWAVAALAVACPKP